MTRGADGVTAAFLRNPDRNTGVRDIERIERIEQSPTACRGSAGSAAAASRACPAPASIMRDDIRNLRRALRDPAR